jgi:hypothetical protein
MSGVNKNLQTQLRRVSTFTATRKVDDMAIKGLKLRDKTTAVGGGKGENKGTGE